MRFRERLRAIWNILLDRPPTHKQVLHCAHELGMHNNSIDPACDLCFEKHFTTYMDICTEALVSTGRVDECLGFRAYLRDRTNHPENRMLIMTEHPAYLMADYLQIGPDTEAFQELVKVTSQIMSKQVSPG